MPPKRRKRLEEPGTDGDTDTEGDTEAEDDEEDDDLAQDTGAPKRARKRGAPKLGRARKRAEAGPAVCKIQDPEARAICWQNESKKNLDDYNRLISRNNKLADDKNNCLLAQGGEERWTTADWAAIPPLPAGPAQVASLHAVLVDAQRAMVGRSEILSRVAAIVHTFANNHRAFSSAYLNFSLEGPPGTGKTTIARTIGQVFRYLGIILTDKFDVLAREDFVGGFLGETAIKTKAVLNAHLEGIILLDEAYSLGAGGGDGTGPDQYGSEAVTAIVGFLDKNQGRIIFMVAGYADRMEADFFGVNPGLARRFPYRFLLSDFTADQLLRMFFQKTLEKTRQSDLSLWSNVSTWRYLRQAFQVLNAHGNLPNQGGDIENLANNALIYVNTYVRSRPPGSAGAPGHQHLTVCDMQQILREYLFNSRHANIIIGNDAINRECGSFKGCSATGDGKSVCVPLVNPDSALILNPDPGLPLASPRMPRPPPMIGARNSAPAAVRVSRRRRGGTASFPVRRPIFGPTRVHLPGPDFFGMDVARVASVRTADVARIARFPQNPFARAFFLAH